MTMTIDNMMASLRRATLEQKKLEARRSGASFDDLVDLEEDAADELLAETTEGNRSVLRDEGNTE